MAMTAMRPRRSVLYLPASNARALAKARELPCDAVILDLEDAVAPDAKAEARASAVEAVRSGGFGRRELVIRVNGLDTPWGRDDLAAVNEALPDGVLVPKICGANDVAAAALLARPPLWLMIETCAAILHLDSLAAASRDHGVAAWVMGTNDLAKEMRCVLDVDRRPLASSLALAVIAARAGGAAPIDGVYNDIDDEAGFERQCREAAELGFDGKSLIHPRQIAIANRIFAPSQDSVRWARAVVAAFDAPENAGKGVLRVDGRMTERLHLDQARELLAIRAAIDAAGER